MDQMWTDHGSSKYWQIFKGVIGFTAAIIAILSYIKGDYIQSICLTFVAIFILGDVIMNWSKYKLLDAKIVTDQKLKID